MTWQERTLKAALEKDAKASFLGDPIDDYHLQATGWQTSGYRDHQNGRCYGFVAGLSVRGFEGSFRPSVGHLYSHSPHLVMWRDREDATDLKLGIPLESEPIGTSLDELPFTDGLSIRISQDTAYFLHDENFRSEFERHRERLGAPRSKARDPLNALFAIHSEPNDNAQTTSKFTVQEFEHGQLTMSTDQPPRPVFAPVLSRYMDAGGYLYLGAAKSESALLEFEIKTKDGRTERTKMRAQIFERGQVIAAQDGRFIATSSGHILTSSFLGAHIGRLPQYRLDVENVTAIDESDGEFGEDHFRATFMHSFLQNGATVDAIERFDVEIDEGETKPINRTLYEGWLPSLSTVSVLGLEDDDTARAKKALDEFERLITSQAINERDIARVARDLQRIAENLGLEDLIAILVDASGFLPEETTEVAIKGYEAGIGWVGTVVAKELFVLAGASIGGSVGKLVYGVVGAAIGALIGLVLGEVISSLANTLNPDPLAIGITTTRPQTIAEAVTTGRVPRQTSETVPLPNGGAIFHNVLYEADGDSLVEIHIYKAVEDFKDFGDWIKYEDDALYRIVLRHTLNW